MLYADDVKDSLYVRLSFVSMSKVTEVKLLLLLTSVQLCGGLARRDNLYACLKMLPFSVGFHF